MMQATATNHRRQRLTCCCCCLIQDLEASQGAHTSPLWALVWLYALPEPHSRQGYLKQLGGACGLSFKQQCLSCFKGLVPLQPQLLCQQLVVCSST